MASETVTLDHASDVGSRTALPLWDPTVGISILDQHYPPPEHKIEYASSPDTEGALPAEHHYENRTIDIKVLVRAGSSTFNANLEKLQQKVGLIQREGGYLRRVLSTGQLLTFTLTNAQIEVPADWQFIQKSHAEVMLTFEALPFGKGVESLSTLTTETSLPVEQHTITNVDGDVPAIGRLIITEADADTQFSLLWGMRSKNYSTDADCALFYEAEGRTAQGGSATAARSGASGGGNNVMGNTALTENYQSVLSTQTTASGSHHQHVGRYRVWARVYDSNSAQGYIQMKLAWSEGDFTQWTENDVVEPPYVADFSIVDFGTVNLKTVASGTQQWQGRFLAKTDDVTLTNNDIQIDCYWLQPLDDGAGKLIVEPQFENSPSSFVAYSNFTTESGVIHGDSLLTGGTWDSNDGSATDASESSDVLVRTATGDASGLNTGWLGVAGATSYTDIAVQVDCTGTLGVGQFQGVLARYTNASNFMVAYIVIAGIGTTLPNGARFNWAVYKRVAGTSTPLVTSGGVLADDSATNSPWYRVRLVVLAGGQWFFYAFLMEGNPVLVASGQDSALATGGALATGKPGIFDQCTSATANTRSYDRFAAWAPTSDAAMFASQSAEVRHDRFHREDSAGALWQPRGDYEGSYCFVPPEGLEARTTEVLVKASRGSMGLMNDPAIDDISVQVGYTPRWLVVPEST